MLFTQPVSDTVTLSSVSAVADIPLPSSPRDSCARVFMTHGGVDVMEAEAVLRSNNQPCWRDHADANVRIPGIDVPSLPPLPSNFPNNCKGDVGMPSTPLLVAHTNQGAGLSPALSWGDSKLPEDPLLPDDAMAMVANRRDTQGKLTRLNNKESLWSALRSLDLPKITLRSSHWIPPHIVATKRWEHSINNTVICAWGSKDEHARERAKYNAANKETKNNGKQ